MIHWCVVAGGQLDAMLSLSCLRAMISRVCVRCCRVIETYCTTATTSTSTSTSTAAAITTTSSTTVPLVVVVVVVVVVLVLV